MSDLHVELILLLDKVDLFQCIKLAFTITGVLESRVRLDLSSPGSEQLMFKYNRLRPDTRCTLSARLPEQRTLGLHDCIVQCGVQ